MVEDLLFMVEQNLDEKTISKQIKPISIKDKIVVKDLIFQYKKDEKNILKDKF